MKFTKGQLKDLETVEYFIPSLYGRENTKITDEDRKAFLLISERGVYPKNKTKGLEALEEGKRWRGIHMGMYEIGVLEGSVPYYTLLGGEDKKLIPVSLKDFMKREMFKGIDAELIETVYCELRKEMV